MNAIFRTDILLVLRAQFVVSRQNIVHSGIQATVFVWWANQICFNKFESMQLKDNALNKSAAKKSNKKCDKSFQGCLGDQEETCRESSWNLNSIKFQSTQPNFVAFFLLFFSFHLSSACQLKMTLMLFFYENVENVWIQTDFKQWLSIIAQNKLCQYNLFKFEKTAVKRWNIDSVVTCLRFGSIILLTETINWHQYFWQRQLNYRFSDIILIRVGLLQFIW